MSRCWIPLAASARAEATSFCTEILVARPILTYLNESIRKQSVIYNTISPLVARRAPPALGSDGLLAEAHAGEGRGDPGSEAVSRDASPCLIVQLARQ